MIQIAVSAFLVWAFFKLVDKEGVVDGFASIAFILVPAILMFFVTLAIAFLGLPNWLTLIFTSSYFIVPLLFLRNITEYKWPKILGYSTAVLIIFMLTQALVLLLLGGPSP